jgi:hypothetical protein
MHYNQFRLLLRYSLVGIGQTSGGTNFSSVSYHSLQINFVFTLLRSIDSEFKHFQMKQGHIISITWRAGG